MGIRIGKIRQVPSESAYKPNKTDFSKKNFIAKLNYIEQNGSLANFTDLVNPGIHLVRDKQIPVSTDNYISGTNIYFGSLIAIQV